VTRKVGQVVGFVARHRDLTVQPGVCQRAPRSCSRVFGRQASARRSAAGCPARRWISRSRWERSVDVASDGHPGGWGPTAPPKGGGRARSATGETVTRIRTYNQLRPRNEDRARGCSATTLAVMITGGTQTWVLAGAGSDEMCGLRFDPHPGPRTATHRPRREFVWTTSRWCPRPP